MKKFIKNIIGHLIEKVEMLMWGDSPVIDDKFIYTEYIDEKIKTDSGFKNAIFLHRTIPYQVWRIEFEDGIFIECADTHILFDENKAEYFVSELKVGMLIYTEYGNKKITNIEKLPYKHCMYDIMCNTPEHRYYTNSILSHNTISSSIYLAWYILFNYDKTVFLCGNIELTAIDILGKVVDVIRNVPFYMKPGIVKNASLEWKFDNGCRLMGAATTKRSGIGFTIHCLYLDEFAHVEKGIIDEFFDNIYPTVSSLPDSKIIVTSTPNGMNRFYQIYDASTKGLNSFKSFKIDWWQVPEWNKKTKCWVSRDNNWMNAQIAQLGDGDMELGQERFGVLYGNSFLSTGNLLLGPNALKRIETNKESFETKIIPEFENFDIPEISYIKWKPDFDIESVKYSDDMFVFSIDPSEGNGGDNAIINIFKLTIMKKEDWENLLSPNSTRDFVGLEQIGIFAYNRIHLSQLSKILYILSTNVFNSENVKMILEWNAFGGEIYNALQLVCGEKNNFDTSTIIKFKRSNNLQKTDPGLRLTHDIKLIYCQNAKRNIGTGKMIIHDIDTIQEFNLFGRKRNSWEAITGHDDRAMSCVDANAFFDSREFEWMSDVELEKHPDLFSELIKLVNQNDDIDTNSINNKSIYAIGSYYNN